MNMSLVSANKRQLNPLPSYGEKLKGYTHDNILSYKAIAAEKKDPVQTPNVLIVLIYLPPFSPAQKHGTISERRAGLRPGKYGEHPAAAAAPAHSSCPHVVPVSA